MSVLSYRESGCAWSLPCGVASPNLRPSLYPGLRPRVQLTGFNSLAHHGDSCLVTCSRRLQCNRPLNVAMTSIVALPCRHICSWHPRHCIRSWNQGFGLMKRRGHVPDDSPSMPSLSSPEPQAACQPFAQQLPGSSRLLSTSFQQNIQHNPADQDVGLLAPPWTRSAFFTDNTAGGQAPVGISDWQVPPELAHDTQAGALRGPSTNAGFGSPAANRPGSSQTPFAGARMQLPYSPSLQWPPQRRPPAQLPPLHPDDPSAWQGLRNQRMQLSALEVRQAPGAHAADPMRAVCSGQDLAGPSAAQWHGSSEHDPSFGWPGPAMPPLQLPSAAWHLHAAPLPAYSVPGCAPQIDAQDAIQLLQSNLAAPRQQHWPGLQGQLESTASTALPAPSTADDGLALSTAISQPHAWQLQEQPRQRHQQQIPRPLASPLSFCRGLSPGFPPLGLAETDAMSQETDMHWDRVAADEVPPAPELVGQQGRNPISPGSDMPGLDDSSSQDELMESEETVAAGKSSQESPSLPVTSGSMEDPTAATGPRRVSPAALPHWLNLLDHGLCLLTVFDRPLNGGLHNLKQGSSTCRGQLLEG